MVFDYSGTSGDAYHRDRHGDLLSNERLYAAWGNYARHTYFRNLSPGSRVLEIGAGLGANLAGLPSNCECVAVEPSPMAREMCARMGYEVLSSIDELGQGDRFDAILLRHVLEHMAEPRTQLLRLNDHLRSDGALTIVLPTENPLKAASDDDPDHHLYCWNRQTATNLLHDTGYVVTDSVLNWMNGRKIFLPVAEKLGPSAYGAAMRALGLVRGKVEIVLWASPHAR